MRRIPVLDTNRDFIDRRASKERRIQGSGIELRLSISFAGVFVRLPAFADFSIISMALEMALDLSQTYR